MIPTITSKIVNTLKQNQIINGNESDIYQYGIEMIISTIINFFVVILIGVIFHEVFSAVLFLVIFAWIRSSSGGYHADTYLKCNSIFAVNLTLVLFWVKFSIDFYSLSNHIIFLMIYFFMIAKYAPLENSNKPLLCDQKGKLKRHCLIYGIIFTVVSLILWYGFDLKKYAVLIAVTMLSVVVSMVDIVLKKGGEYYEKDYS